MDANVLEAVAEARLERAPRSTVQRFAGRDARERPGRAARWPAPGRQVQASRSTAKRLRPDDRGNAWSERSTSQSPRAADRAVPRLTLLRRGSNDGARRQASLRDDHHPLRQAP